MKVIDFNAARSCKRGIFTTEPITFEDLKVMTGSELLDELQEAIDLLVTLELHSMEWNHVRNWIDDIVGLLDSKL